MQESAVPICVSRDRCGTELWTEPRELWKDVCVHTEIELWIYMELNTSGPMSFQIMSLSEQTAVVNQFCLSQLLL